METHQTKATGRSSYANHQEDLEVLEFFNDRPGVFVEAGANHPVQASQTYLLEQHGWRGVLIEPNPVMAGLCRKLRPASQTFDCALVEPGGPEQVRMRAPKASAALASIVPDRHTSQDPDADYFECPARTLDSVLEESGIAQIDFFSIDLEGYELQALKGFDWNRWRPQLLTIEDHCESFDKHRALLAQDYQLLRRVGDNSWYVPRNSSHSMSLGDRVRFVRKMYLSMPFRLMRRLSRSIRGKEGS